MSSNRPGIAPATAPASHTLGRSSTAPPRLPCRNASHSESSPAPSSILDLELDEAVSTLSELKDRYPIVLCRDLNQAKQWVRERAQGSERYGMVVSSQAQRLRPHSIDVRVNIDPVHWFLDPKDDVRSSWFLEEAASEFDVQGLELDWTVVVWDADFRHNGKQWENYSFTGGKWQRINAPQRKLYQKNAYRVLLTRARQGMVVVVPEGKSEDYSRQPSYYDGTWDYLHRIGLAEAG